MLVSRAGYCLCCKNQLTCQLAFEKDVPLFYQKVWIPAGPFHHLPLYKTCTWVIHIWCFEIYLDEYSWTGDIVGGNIVSGTCSLTECNCNKILCICIGHLEIEFLNGMTCRQGTTILGLEPALLLPLCIQILDYVEEKNLSYFLLGICVMIKM